MELSKSYTPGEIEAKWYANWEANGYFKPTNEQDKPNYCIQLPPPNVTGTLHMGHAFQQTIMDVLIRYHRMLGYNTLWQPGTDHAGIATQIVVERKLEAEGLNRKELGRDAFIKKVWEWKDYSGNTITYQMRRLGVSCDWSRERFTMDEGLSQAVTKVFVDLYNQGLIYRGFRLVNWDIKLQTAVSDLEVVSQEEDGFLWYIAYPLKDSAAELIIATTRPETMLGDVAVAVNPSDERYQHLIGKTILLPLVEREIPIIADDYVDPEFGTGCVKITPAHDFNDYQIGIRHNLEAINILSLDGKINQNAPIKYQALDRFKARELILTDLEALGLLKATKPHKLVVPRCERTNTIIEPMLTRQWYMKMDQMAKKALSLVDSGQIQFVPDMWQKIYANWLNNIEDWCISRQLWWGHRIPAFYDEVGNVFVTENLTAATILANNSELTQDSDVLDTWFSSALWPFSTLAWPKSSQELEHFLPSSVLVTGFDIIFFWVARMVMLTEHFTAKVPFKDVYINGLIMDAHGEKMSKSKGNVIDPIDVIDGINLESLIKKRTSNLMNPKMADKITKQTKNDYPDGFMAFGADSLRFSLLSVATNARYINFDLKRIEGSRNFCNKLYNATKFVLMQIDNHNNLLTNTLKPNNFIDGWILSRLNQAITQIQEAFLTYRFDLAAQNLYEFVWNEFCDWYLELAKISLNNQEFQLSTINTLVYVLENILRLAHPFIPFLTEELWQALNSKIKVNKPSIMLEKYPTIFNLDELSTDLNSINLLKDIISNIRVLRSNMHLNPGQKFPLLVKTKSPQLIYPLQTYIVNLAKISELIFSTELDTTLAPIVIVNDISLMLKVEIDPVEEKLRLEREITRLNNDFDKIKLKLDNPNYVARAPKELVIRDQDLAVELKLKLNQLNEAYNRLN